jgi:hypothetical protein
MILEASIMLLDDIYGTGITHDDWYNTRDMFIVQATGVNVIKLLCVNDGAAKYPRVFLRGKAYLRVRPTLLITIMLAWIFFETNTLAYSTRIIKKASIL